MVRLEFTGTLPAQLGGARNKTRQGEGERVDLRDLAKGRLGAGSYRDPVFSHKLTVWRDRSPTQGQGGKALRTVYHKQNPVPEDKKEDQKREPTSKHR